MMHGWKRRLAGAMLMAGVCCQGAGVPATSGVLAEVWTGIKGGAVADLTSHGKYKKPPNAVRVLADFSAASIGDSCGARYSAILTPPTTGDYTFWIAADDSAELWLSTTLNPKQAVKIADVPRYVGEGAWTQLPSQESAPVRLESGKGCYLMALHKDLGGADHAAVAWSGPGLERQVIAARHLALPPTGGKVAKLLEKARALEKTFADFAALGPNELQAFVEGLNAADHRGLAEKLTQKLTTARKGREPQLLQTLARLGSALTPGPDTPVSDPILKTVLAFEDAYLKTLSTDKLEALGPHRTATAFGPFPGAAAPDSQTVRISSRPDKQAAEWVSTGLYALPGKRVTVVVPNEWAAKGMKLRIGHHNTASAKNVLDCMPDTRRQAVLKTAETAAVSPYGGLLFIEVPKEVGLSDVSVTLSGAVTAPRFVLGETTDETWRDSREAPAPWGELVADRIVIVAHSEALRQLDNPTKLMTWWDDAVTRHEGFYNHDRGMPFRMHGMHFARMGVSYWPLEWSKTRVDSILDARKLAAYSDGLFLHEHGHHCDNGAMFFGNIGESTCNWAGYYMKGTGADFAWKDTEETHMLALFDRTNSHHQEITQDKWWTKRYTHYWSYPCTSMMVGYVQGFGWEAFKTVVHRFTRPEDPVNTMGIFQTPVTKKRWHQLSAEDKEKLNQIKIDKWLIFLSQEAKHDVRPYFVHFALKASAKTATVLDRAGLPKWDLVYVPRRPVIVSMGQAVSIPSPAQSALTFSGALTWEWKGEPLHGTLTAGRDGTVHYQPEPHFTGVESIPYTLTNCHGNLLRGDLRIHVVRDRENPHIAAGRLTNLTAETWTAIRFPRAFRKPVVIVDAMDEAGVKGPQPVARIRKLKSRGCEAMVVPAADVPSGTAATLVWAVMEAGTYTLEKHGVDAVAAIVKTRPEGLSNDMDGVLVSLDDDRGKLRSTCFGQILSTQAAGRAEFYWQADRQACGLRVGGHCGLAAPPPAREKVGYALLPRGLYQCGSTLVKVGARLTVGEHTLDLGSTNLKSVLRSQRHALKFRDRYGKNSVIVGGWETKDGKLKTEFTARDWSVTNALGNAGEYEVIFAADDRARNALHIRSLAVLRNGAEIASDVHDGMTGKTASKGNHYRVRLRRMDARAEYALRADVRVDQVSGVYGSVILRPLPH